MMSTKRDDHWQGPHNIDQRFRFVHKAVGGGHLEVLKWARSQGSPWEDRTCVYISEGHPRDNWTFVTADLEVLQRVRSQGCPWDETTCTHAAEGGHLEVLKWVRRQGWPLG